MQQVAHEPNHEQGLRVSKHIFVGNSRLVTALTHQAGIDTTEQAAKLYYYHADHLQSAQFITDANGEKYEHIEYTPYGELWTYKSKTAMLFLTTYNNFLAKQPAGLIEETAQGIDKLPFRFTGKELDEETGLYYYGARYLDPKYSRWLSGDPALGEYIPQAGADTSKLPNGGVYNTQNPKPGWEGNIMAEATYKPSIVEQRDINRMVDYISNQKIFGYQRKHGNIRPWRMLY